MDPYGLQFQVSRGNRCNRLTRTVSSSRSAEVTDVTDGMVQAMLQAENHVERLAIMDKVLEKEAKRLAARSTLQSLFKQ